MPYIGNDIQFGELTSQTFTGDGSTVAFTMGYSVANTTSILVTSGNVVQEPTVAYTVSGTTLTFTSAPEDDDTIHVRFLGRVVDVANAAILQDSDQDTKVQVEESADEDTIRFDVAGAEVATLTNSALILKGTTPTLTIGDAGAEDTKLVFDGNAQDYHIGLDDTDDDLKIGLGSALGTTPHMVFDETGAITKPLQPSFLVFNSATDANATGDGTAVTVDFNSEVIDANNDFASDTFTAPVAGKYFLQTTVFLQQTEDSTNTRYRLIIVTSNRTYVLHEKRLMRQNDGGQNLADVCGSAVVDMDASDTAIVQVAVYGGAAVVDIWGNSQPETYFSGCLLA
jgi:hypothetical protein